MQPSAYQERVWEAIPAGLAPAPAGDARCRFLLACARDGDGARDGERALRVLDVGCGDGRLTLELALAGYDVVGADVAEEPLRRARERGRKLDLRLISPHGDWPFEDASFDLVWAGDVVEHVADTLAFFSELRRVLRSGGTVALATPAHTRVLLLAIALSPYARAFERHFDPRADHLRFYSRRSLERLLCDFGFHDISVGVAGRVLPPSRRVLLARAQRSRFAG